MKFFKKILVYYVLVNFIVTTMGFNLIHHHCDICRVDDIHLFENDDCCATNSCELEKSHTYFDSAISCCEDKAHNCSNNYEYHILKQAFTYKTVNLKIYPLTFVLFFSQIQLKFNEFSYTKLTDNLPPLIKNKDNVIQRLCCFLL
ncbi:MAG TPA: hypothetical protein DDX39_06815 [Bacteroidales bacterium]|nr:MAG: hypothetical protein A2W98_05895 [Bacteroidetes bacterium GWF2_33_38]OFY74459.1 MAG: hypothetical protein A2265_08290 [Bacteroidetes bacterium RIFOXYA12_FULL_33_9]OFY92160.1 MAG: hypothetical protein A2236_07570 [Bacteroidetes bacterium RIFOXYA2_FULL_33_7]HBF88339.1 hypothetical protein [Bacteroidales bacterium]